MAVIDQEKINEIKIRLKALPKVEAVKSYTKQTAVAALSKDILALSRKGYDPKQIAEILKQEGLSASIARVRRILEEENGGQAVLSEEPVITNLKRANGKVKK